MVEPVEFRRLKGHGGMMGNLQRSTDAADRLVLKAQSGDRQALDDLLKRHEVSLLRHLYRLIGEEAAAYDALQETFLVVARNLGKLRSREKLKAWVFGVATRVALKKQSKRWRSRLDYGLDSETPDRLADTDKLVFQKEQIDAMLKEVGTLPPALRSVILLHYLEELTMCETAKALELPLGTVKSRLAAGLQRLRDRLSIPLDAPRAKLAK